MVKSTLDILASDLDASFGMRPVVADMPTAGALPLLEPIVFDTGAGLFHCASGLRH